MTKSKHPSPTGAIIPGTAPCTCGHAPEVEPMNNPRALATRMLIVPSRRIRTRSAP